MITHDYYVIVQLLFSFSHKSYIESYVKQTESWHFMHVFVKIFAYICFRHLRNVSRCIIICTTILSAYNIKTMKYIFLSSSVLVLWLNCSYYKVPSEFPFYFSFFVLMLWAYRVPLAIIFYFISHHFLKMKTFLHTFW